MGRPRKTPPPLGPIWAADVVAFIETVCFVPEGRHVGRPLKLQPWQKDLLRLIYDNPAGPTRRAILSLGRKNGKSSLAACLLLAHLCGPPARNKPNSQLFSAAQSRDQAALVFSLASKMVRMNPVLAQAVQIQETAKSLACAELGTRYRALSSETNTAFGLSPAFIIHDELGRVRGPRSELYDALETAVGAQEDPLSIIISTQAPTDGDLLSNLIDDALKGDDPRTVIKLFTAPLDLDPFSEEAIRAANPAFGTFLNAREVLAMAEDARRMPARENEFKNLILNQRVEIWSPYLTRNIWERCAGQPLDLSNKTVLCGLDLSATNDLTALAMVHCDPRDGVWHVRMHFWLPKERLIERAARDNIPHDLWQQQGWLEVTDGPVVDYDYVGRRLKEIFATCEVRKVGFDRWNMQYFKPALLRAGFSQMWIDRTMVEFGQGLRDMSPAMRATEELALNGKIRHGNNPLLNWNLSNCVVELDAAGNRKLNKAKSRGRIDGVIALLMAVGVAPTAWSQPFDARALIG
jgi:phage terminase large subunit-like protein